MQDVKVVALSAVKPTVYLDQWVWVELSRASLGKSTAWVDAHEAVTAAATEGRCIFPLSQSHIIETCKNRNTGSRARLLEYMVPRWGQTSMLPWYMVAELECRNAILASLGSPILDLRPHIFKNGLLRGFGGEPTLKAKEGSMIDQAKADEILAKLNGDEMLEFMKQDDIAEGFAAAWPDQEAWVQELQEIANRDYGEADKTLRNQIAEAKFLAYTVGEPLNKELLEMVHDPRAWMEHALEGLEEIRLLRSRIPSLNAFWTLTHSRDRVKRPVQVNDIHDMQLSLAIPYCDVVATERKWARAAQVAGLDEIYETRLCWDGEALANAVNALG